MMLLPALVDIILGNSAQRCPKFMATVRPELPSPFGLRQGRFQSQGNGLFQRLAKVHSDFGT